MRYVLIGLAAFVFIMTFFLIVYFKDVKKHSSGKADTYASKYDEETEEFYPVLNGDADTANVLVTLPDGSKGWTDGLGNGYIR